jgi:hypothetical protein
MRRRHLFSSLVLFVSHVVSHAHAAEVEFVRVWPQWRTAESFERISEFFGGGENTGGKLVLRTQADTRAGYYFIIRLAHAASLNGAKFEVSLIRPDTTEPKSFLLPVTTTGKDDVVELGLTGADWPGGEKAHPVAWKLTLRAADGRVLAEQKSFLWENPAK